MSLKRLWLLHPFLFALFPTLFVYAHNFDDVPAADLLLPLLAVSIGTLLLWLALRFFSDDPNKVAALASYLIAIFFSFGRIRKLLPFPDTDEAFWAMLTEGLLWTALLSAGFFVILGIRRSFALATRFLNVVAATLVALSLGNIGLREVARPQVTLQTAAHHLGSTSRESPRLPDIYYIILDEYARADTLKDIYNYDNSEFLEFLRHKGFYVAPKSHSSYAMTVQSMAASLNMKHLSGNEKYSELVEMIQNSEVSRWLKLKGYRYIFITSGFFEKGADRYAEVHLAHKIILGMKVSDLAVYLIESSPLRRVTSAFLADNVRERIKNSFRLLNDMPDIREPTFVLAHIAAPHSPYVFNRYGNPAKMLGGEYSLEQRRSFYLDQLIFINGKVKALVDAILTKSETAPVIILQSDHGPRWEKGRERDILNAYCFPGKDYGLVNESVNPVNSFRILFNLYFDSHYELLDD